MKLQTKNSPEVQMFLIDEGYTWIGDGDETEPEIDYLDWPVLVINLAIKSIAINNKFYDEYIEVDYGQLESAVFQKKCKELQEENEALQNKLREIKNLIEDE